MAKQNTRKTKKSHNSKKIQRTKGNDTTVTKEIINPKETGNRFLFRKRKSREKQHFLPGYISFTKDVFRTIVQHRTLFVRLLGLSFVFSLIVFGASEQSQFISLRNSIIDLSSATTTFDQRSLAVGALFLSTISGGLSSAFTEAQQGYNAVFYLFLVLIIVWLLRYILSGSDIKLRDALYNAGSPVIATVLVGLFGIVQLLPAAIGVSIYSTVAASGAANGFVVGLFLIIALLLSALSLYWLTSTLFALILTTLPGSYPIASIRSANKLVKGMRIRILLRILWLLFVFFIYALILLVPAISIDIYGDIAFPPIVLLVTQFLAISSTIYGSTYIYLLYRKVIDERS